jgi:hypothetical protein
LLTGSHLSTRPDSKTFASLVSFALFVRSA